MTPHATCDAKDCDAKVTATGKTVMDLQLAMERSGWKVGSGDGTDPDYCPKHIGGDDSEE